MVLWRQYKLGMMTPCIQGEHSTHPWGTALVQDTAKTKQDEVKLANFKRTFKKQTILWQRILAPLILYFLNATHSSVYEGQMRRMQLVQAHPRCLVLPPVVSDPLPWSEDSPPLPKLRVLSWYQLLRLASSITLEVESEHGSHSYTMETKEMWTNSGILFFLRSKSLITSYPTMAGHSTVKLEASSLKPSDCKGHLFYP